MRRRRRIGVTLVTLLGAFALYEITTSMIAYTGDAYVTSDLVALAPEVTGRIIEVKVTDNQSVQKGDLLALIDPVPFQLTADQRRAEVDEAAQQVTVDQDMIATARDTLASATSAEEYARETQKRLAILEKTQDVSRADLDRGDDALRRANAALDASREAIARAEATVAMHRAGQARAVAALGTAEWQLTRTRLTAPTSGTVTNLTVRVGDTAQTDVPLIGIVDAHAWRIIANYKESYIRGLSPGDPAWVWLDASPWHLRRAKVTGIARGISRNPTPRALLPYVAPTVDWIRLQRRFPVTLTLTDPPADLILYMGSDARVLILP
jgi:membrane fusion protein, multidrug efflux system